MKNKLNSRKNLLQISSLLIIFLLFVNGGLAFDPIPSPKLIFSGKQDSGDGTFRRTIYWLSVENRTEFPEEMFEPAPDLPPCGLNKNASRSWIDVMDSSNHRLYAFCAIRSTSDLNKLSFSLPEGATPPEYVYIVITDRKTKQRYSSNLIPITK